MEYIDMFLKVCGAISIIGGAAAVLCRWASPAIRFNDRVEVLEKHDKRNYEVLKDVSDRDALILEALITMLDSQITGNNVEQLKQMKGRLIEHLSKSQCNS